MFRLISMSVLMSLILLNVVSADPRKYPQNNIIVEFILRMSQTDRSKIAGQLGYVYVSDQLFHGNMYESFLRVSKALNKSDFNSLDWGNAYRGQTTGFWEERDRFFLNGEIVSKFKGLEGYFLYANTFYDGQMQKAYLNMSAVLSEREKSELSWGQQYRGYTSEFHAERRRLTSESSVSEFVGVEGYLRYADTFYDGQMQRAYLNMSAVLTEKEKIRLAWGKAYHGHSSDFRVERGRLISNGKAVKEYVGPDGYVKYADRFYSGRMQKAYLNMSAVLSDEEKSKLAWGKVYHGNSQEFRVERDRLIYRGNPVKEYVGPDGYIRYADRFYAGKMQKAYMNMSAVLSDEEKSKLGWGKAFHGRTTDFIEMRSILYKSGGDSIDFDKWFGKADGLSKAVEEYMYKLGHSKPFNKRALNKIRWMMRVVVSES
jgi:hypothetical protein